jgi:hypothetical protein
MCWQKKCDALAAVPTENLSSGKIAKVREPRRVNHSGFRSMIAWLAAKTGEVSPSRSWRIVLMFIVSTYIKVNGSQATRRS